MQYLHKSLNPYLSNFCFVFKWASMATFLRYKMTKIKLSLYTFWQLWLFGCCITVNNGWTIFSASKRGNGRWEANKERRKWRFRGRRRRRGRRMKFIMHFKSLNWQKTFILIFIISYQFYFMCNLLVFKSYAIFGHNLIWILSSHKVSDFES